MPLMLTKDVEFVCIVGRWAFPQCARRYLKVGEASMARILAGMSEQTQKLMHLLLVHGAEVLLTWFSWCSGVGGGGVGVAGT